MKYGNNSNSIGIVNHFCCLALATGNPKAHVPYASLSRCNIKNFPSELKFGHPSTFGNDALCRILDCAEDIQFDCKFVVQFK